MYEPLVSVQEKQLYFLYFWCIYTALQTEEQSILAINSHTKQINDKRGVRCCSVSRYLHSR